MLALKCMLLYGPCLLPGDIKVHGRVHILSRLSICLAIWSYKYKISKSTIPEFSVSEELRKGLHIYCL